MAKKTPPTDRAVTLGETSAQHPEDQLPSETFTGRYRTQILSQHKLASFKEGLQ